MIRSASPGPTGARGACPAARVPITVNRAGRVGAGAGHISGPHRVAVHRRVGERRHVLGRGHRLGQDQAQGVVDVTSARRLRLAGGDDLGLGLVEGDHGLSEPSSR